MVKIIESPLYIQDGKYFYTSDPVQPGTRYPIGLNPNKPYRYIKGLAGLNPKTDIYDSFYNPATRRVFQVTSENIEEAMSLVEDIDLRKKLLYDSGVLSNPYNFNDL